MYMAEGSSAANNPEKRAALQMLTPHIVDNTRNFVDVSLKDAATVQTLQDTVGKHWIVRELQWGKIAPLPDAIPKSVYTAAIHITGVDKEFMGSNYPVPTSTKVAILDSGLCSSIWNVGNLLKDTKVTLHNVISDADTANDCDGHGTMMYGIIRSLLPETELLIVKMLEQDEFCMADLKNAALWALDNGATFVCVSLSLWRPLSKESLDDLQIVHTKAVQKKAILCFASGNEKATFWTEGFYQKFPQFRVVEADEQNIKERFPFHIVGSKDCRNEDWTWAPYCFEDDNGNAKLKICHGEDIISYAAVKLEKRFTPFLMNKSWIGAPEKSNYPLVVASGTSQANAIYTALLAIQLEANRDTTQLLREILDHFRTKFQLFIEMASPPGTSTPPAGQTNERTDQDKEEINPTSSGIQFPFVTTNT